MNYENYVVISVTIKATFSVPWFQHYNHGGGAWTLHSDNVI